MRQQHHFINAISRAQVRDRSGMSTVFLMALRTLGEPLLQNIVLMHVQLESWTQANVRFDFGLGFTIEPRQVFCSQLGDKQFKLEFLLAFFQMSQGGQFLFELLISEFLGAYLAAFVALRRVNVASAKLRKEKTVRILNGFAMSFFRNLDTRVRDIKEVLEVFHCIELIKVRQKRARMEILESSFENEIL
jgi:hypothetical protein